MSINGTIGNLAYYNDEKVVLGKSVAYFMIQKSIIEEYDGSVSALLKSKGRGYVEVQLWSDRYVKPLPKGENADGTDR